MKLFLCSHFSNVGNLMKEDIEGKKVAFLPTASIHEWVYGLYRVSKNNPLRVQF